MAGSAFSLEGGRIGNANRTWAAAQDVDVTGWVKTNHFIIAAMVLPSGHSGGSSSLRLEWRNLTDGGAWTVLGASGQLKYGATDLVDGNAVVHGEEGVTSSYPANHEDGRENEGSNARTITTAQNYHEEDQHSVSPADALDGKEYEFRVYDVTAAAVVGTLLCTITMAISETEATVRLAGLGDLEAIKSIRLAGTTDLEATAKQRIAGLADLETGGTTRLAGRSELEKINLSRLAGLGDLEKISIARIAGLADLETFLSARLAGMADLEAVKTSRVAALSDLEAGDKERLAGRADFEDLGTEEVARIAGLGDLEAVITARLAGLSDLEKVSLSRIAGLGDLEAMDKARIAGSADLEITQMVRMAGAGDLEAIENVRLAGRADFDIVIKTSRLAGRADFYEEGVPGVDGSPGHPLTRGVMPGGAGG